MRLPNSEKAFVLLCMKYIGKYSDLPEYEQNKKFEELKILKRHLERNKGDNYGI